MNTPVVTMKITPKELRMVDAGLQLLSTAATMLHQSCFQTLDKEAIVKAVKRFAIDTADGDARRLMHRANMLRASIDL